MTLRCRATPSAPLLALANDAAGDPLYLTELLDAADRSGRLHITDAGLADISGGALPASLGEAITDRLRFLTSDTREAIATAALLGPEFTVEELATVCGRQPHDLASALRQAHAGGVLSDGGDVFSFRHPLIRTALYEEQPLAVRAAWHRNAARALAEAHAAPEQVARQLHPALTVEGTPVIDGWIIDWLLADASL